MALTLNSPGVQIIETDLSQNLSIVNGTSVFAAGFAAQGPTDEVIQLTSKSDLDTIYGTPTTPAERYFYYSCQQVLNSQGNLLTTRLPYGLSSGYGFASNQYSALFFPTASASTGFALLPPTHVTVSEYDFTRLLQKNFTWSTISTTSSAAGWNSSTGTATAGLIILNDSQTTVNEYSEGYYASITDNSQFGPTTDFVAVTQLLTLTSADSFYSVPTTRLDFTLSAAAGYVGNQSVSQQIERAFSFDFSQPQYNDCIALNLFKVRNSVYNPSLLTISTVETYVGSLNAQRNIADTSGGTPKSFFISDIVDNVSSNITIYVNPAIANSGAWTSSAPTVSAQTYSLYADGVYQPSYANANNKQIGNVVTKINRALTLIDSPEVVKLDVVLDSGLSTIFANIVGSTGNNTSGFNDAAYYDDNVYIDTTSDPITSSTAAVNQKWLAVFNIFDTFVSQTRKDCVFIADPLRQIFVNGPDTKTLAIKSNTFTQNIYSPLKAVVGQINTNYSAIYGNWIKIYDPYADAFVWQPASGFVGSVFANSDAASQPWYAPAGLTRGLIKGATDLAITPNQKQRDYLYLLSVNPIAFTAGSYTVYGQKTMQSSPTAFDRINVRRLFLTLERAVHNTVKYFVFEPNTDFTRTRLINTITPIFELAKNTQGLYDYKIVCDARNNTPAIIDQNELAVDIYIKPVRSAEFILVNFIATTTGQNFSELV
jgi:hypothetical protein